MATKKSARGASKPAKGPATGSTRKKSTPKSRKSVAKLPVAAARPALPAVRSAKREGTPDRASAIESGIAGLRQRLRTSPEKVRARGPRRKGEPLQEATSLDAALKNLAERYRDLLG